MNEDNSCILKHKAEIEALLFVSEKPLLIEQIKGVLDDMETDKIRDALLELKSDYERSDRGLRIVEIAGGFQIVTSSEVAETLKKFYKLRDAQRLSKSALETLAIIAYKQPVTRLDIESLRGVNVDGMIRSLMEKNLIRIAGRKDVIGRPFVYATTKQFLEYFGLASLADLPKAEELAKGVHGPQGQEQLLSLSNRTESFISAVKGQETNPIGPEAKTIEGNLNES
jgi:segregation and condensation protein B